MTPEQQRIAIAEACGWNDPHWECPRCGRVENSHVTYEERHDKEGCLQFVHWVEAPNYLNDLNAMHEAEKTLTEEQFELYAFWVAHVTPLGRQLVATASQRAEAFLKTLGLWKAS